MVVNNIENLVFYVKGMGITLVSSPSPLTNNRNVVRAKFIFTDEWIGVKTALFNVFGVTYPMLIGDDNTCGVPWEVYTSSKNEFSVGVICGDLRTTNLAKVTFDKSCYTQDVSISKPCEDIYSQIIEKINGLENGSIDEDLVEDIVEKYLLENSVNTNKTSEFITNVNGSTSTWISGVSGFSVSAINVYESVPAKFNTLVNYNNKNLASYYGEASSDGVRLSEDIASKIDKITFSGVIHLLENYWYSTEFRLIAHSPDCVDTMYLGEEYNFVADKCVELGTFGVPLGGKRSANFNPRPFFIAPKNTETGEIISRNGWILKLQMKSDSSLDILTNRSNIILIFNEL
ncbi:MAG: hypothetical protein ACK5LY_04975 [Lachnospirales bacterium]